MASLKAVIVPGKSLKNGKHKVRISVAHNGQTRYIITNIVLDSEKEFKNGVVVKRNDAAYLNTKLRGLIQRYQDLIDELPYVNGLSCPELIWQLQNGLNGSHRSLVSVAEEYIEKMGISEQSRIIYNNHFKRLFRHIDKNMLIDNITYGTVVSAENYLRGKRFAPGTITITISAFKAVINYAVKCGYVSYKISPFTGIKLPSAGIRNSWISVDEIRKIRDLDLKKSNLIYCRDLFMLSYYLGGINFADLKEQNFKENKGILRYCRKKVRNRTRSKAPIEFKIPEEALPIIERHTDKKGYLKLYSKTQLRYNMNKLAQITGIKNLIYYSARKSFSQHAFELGISTTVIDYILGHTQPKSKSCLYAYITVPSDMATAAIRKVLDNLKGSE
ncbi:MAG: site-specific integrase [Duncaniella sp.]|nr:site-specific integrase [Duncaniella sp.]